MLSELEKLEKRATSVGISGFTPGTSLTRILVANEDNKSSEINWCLGIGGFQQPKKFFRGSSIQRLLDEASQWLDKFTR